MVITVLLYIVLIYSFAHYFLIISSVFTLFVYVQYLQYLLDAVVGLETCKFLTHHCHVLSDSVIRFGNHRHDLTEILHIPLNFQQNT